MKPSIIQNAALCIFLMGYVGSMTVKSYRIRICATNVSQRHPRKVADAAQTYLRKRLVQLHERNAPTQALVPTISEQRIQGAGHLLPPSLVGLEPSLGAEDERIRTPVLLAPQDSPLQPVSQSSLMPGQMSDLPRPCPPACPRAARCPRRHLLPWALPCSAAASEGRRCAGSRG